MLALSADYARIVSDRLGWLPTSMPHMIGADASCAGVSLALVGSRRCPQALVALSRHLCRTLADQPIVVMGGFQSALERACLAPLLAGRCHVLMWLAHDPADEPALVLHQEAIRAGKLTLIAPFSADEARSRPPAQRAHLRNAIMVALADALLVLYAAPYGSVEGLCKRAMMEWVTPVYALNHPHNARIIALAAAWSG